MKKFRCPQKIIYYKMGLWDLLKEILQVSQSRRIFYHSLSLNVKTIFKFSVLKKICRQDFKQYYPPKYISEYSGAFFLIENTTIRLTERYFAQEMKAFRKSTKSYRKFYRSDRIDIFSKFLIQQKIREYLRFYYQIKRSDEKVTIVVPRFHLYIFIMNEKPFENLRSVPVIFLQISCVYYILFGFQKLISCLCSNLRILILTKYCLKDGVKKTYKLCIRGHNPKREGLLRNDFLIDGTSIKKEDTGFLIEGNQSNHRNNMVNYCKINKFSYIVLNNIRLPTRYLGRMIKGHIVLPVKAFFLYLKHRDPDKFNAQLDISRIILRSKYELFLLNFNIGIFLSFHSAGNEMLIAPILCERYKSKFGIYNFGTTVSWGRWAPYCYQTADYYFSWGRAILSPYRSTCRLKKEVFTGFWAKQEYERIYSKRDKIKRKVFSEKITDRVVTFYDIPYLFMRSTFKAEFLYDFYKCALKCSEIEGITVILKMKSKLNVNGARYPESIRKKFENLWAIIKDRNNIHIFDTAEFDPLEMVAISEVNVTIELGSPSTIALILGEAGLFYNKLYDYSEHILYPKYFNKVIFDDEDKLLYVIKKHLEGEIDLKSSVEKKDLEGYDHSVTTNGLSLFRKTINQISDI